MATQQEHFVKNEEGHLLTPLAPLPQYPAFNAPGTLVDLQYYRNDFIGAENRHRTVFDTHLFPLTAVKILAEKHQALGYDESNIQSPLMQAFEKLHAQGELDDYLRVEVSFNEDFCEDKVRIQLWLSEHMPFDRSAMRYFVEDFIRATVGYDYDRGGFPDATSAGLEVKVTEFVADPGNRYARLAEFSDDLKWLAQSGLTPAQMQDKIKKLHTEHAPPLDLDAYLDDLALFNYNFNNVPINHYALLPDPMVKFIDKIPALIEKSGLNIDTEAFKEAYVVDMRQSGGYFTDIALKSDKPDPSQDQDYQNLLKALDNDLMHDEYAFHAGQFSPEPAVNTRPKR